ncbi:MAG: hypothetical protein J7K00_01010 [Candidatus Diapherotrites archaeon]|nr:hypothetical protein [Candidatus Diapherotrites archaeon]
MSLLLFGCVEEAAEPIDKGTGVLLIGMPSEGVEELFNSTDFLNDFNCTVKSVSELDIADIGAAGRIVLQGDPNLPRRFRDKIGERVQEGAGLIVVGDAATRDANLTVGWAYCMGYVPARFVEPLSGKNSKKVEVEGKIKAMELNHPMLAGFERSAKKYILFEVISKGKEIALIERNTVDTARGYNAVIEGENGLGKVVYFSYDAGETPRLFLSALNYI